MQTTVISSPGKKWTLWDCTLLKSLSSQGSILKSSGVHQAAKSYQPTPTSGQGGPDNPSTMVFTETFPGVSQLHLVCGCNQTGHLAKRFPMVSPLTRQIKITVSVAAASGAFILLPPLSQYIFKSLPFPLHLSLLCFCGSTFYSSHLVVAPLPVVAIS